MNPYEIVSLVLGCLILACGFVGIYIAAQIHCEEKTAGEQKRKGELMSFSKKFEGDVEKIVTEVEAAVKTGLSAAEAKVHTIVADIAKGLQAIAGEGKKLLMGISSSGHFNPDGTGSATISISSSAAPAAETPPPAGAPAEGAQKSG